MPVGSGIIRRNSSKKDFMMNQVMRFTSAVILGAAAWASITNWHGQTAQADSTYALASPASKFIVRTLPVANGFQVVRMDSTTGDSWYPSSGKWAKYVDDSPPGPGVYDIQLLPLPDGKSYNMVRSDLSSGRVWYIVGTKWVMFTEP